MGRLFWSKSTFQPFTQAVIVV